VLGVEVDAITAPALLDAVAAAVDEGRPMLVANHNLHSARLVRDDEQMQAFFRRAATVLVDGMPLVWAARLLGHDVARAHRVTCVDWIPQLLSLAELRGWRVFVLASDPVTHDRGMAVIGRRYPDLDLVGRDGWFELGGDEDDAVVRTVRDTKPDVVLVGMGMPRQERWLATRIDDLDAPVVVTVGGWLDYVAGARRTPPRWVARVGFEWLARLVDEPRRLAHRYLVEPWPLVPVFARELWAARVARRPWRANVRSG
jgi:N-acetylglucosaminyldiphosphoundecaprenol N-acetyl-beta-D-mannosaminyltransferase